ncbi:MAG: ribosome biogenesis GTP-binding protein YihA/YsxC [Firmicutes bacterium]|nr:ribosome biogenesis GTP-binding protein YihA/YsxC [Bacillota bacterium]
MYNLVASALDESEMPKTGWTEIAFMGRSNAGKSSLINRLVGQKIAHTSSDPGRTQRIHFYQASEWYLVDLPGFGYAKVPLAVKKKFGDAVERYLTARDPLRGGILIQDCRRDPEDGERMIQRWAYDRNLYLFIVATKMDKLNRKEQQERQNALNEQYGQNVLLASSRTGEGIEQVVEIFHRLGLKI